jgi:hypothetical protein
MAMNAAQPLEVFRLKVFDLLVGHELLSQPTEVIV